MSAITKSPESLYGSDFHSDRDERTRETARLILSHVQKWIAPNSICDVGCGTGTWLAAAEELGFADIQGFEGPWAKTANLVIDNTKVSFQDLESKVCAERRFDLVVSLEVAEHLSQNRSAPFVADLCALGDIVLFSAAIPMQGGTGHVTERWQSHWAALFEEQDYAAYDPVRPLIWSNNDVAFWYRQNTLLYARRGSVAAAKLDALGFGPPVMADLVHPDQYLHAEAAQPARAISRKVKQMLGRT